MLRDAKIRGRRFSLLHGVYVLSVCVAMFWAFGLGGYLHCGAGAAIGNSIEGVLMGVTFWVYYIFLLLGALIKGNLGNIFHGNLALSMVRGLLVFECTPIVAFLIGGFGLARVKTHLVFYASVAVVLPILMFGLGLHFPDSPCEMVMP